MNRQSFGGAFYLPVDLPLLIGCTHSYNFRRELLDEKPYLSEAGPAVFDALYDTVIRQVSYIVKSPALSHNMVSLYALIKDSINVLIGVPSATFHLDKVIKETVFILSS